MVGEESTTTVASPRISFSADFLDDDSFISISPGSSFEKDEINNLERSEFLRNKGLDFEFLSSKNSFDAGHATMLAADELIFQGKLLPYSHQINHATEKLTTININIKDTDKEPSNHPETGTNDNNKASTILLGRETQEPRIWFVDDDPSPRPPKCTVLWKELLRLKKQRPSSTLSPSSSSSSSSSASSSLGDVAVKMEDKDKNKDKDKDKEKEKKEKGVKKVKKGLERTRSATIRIRPMFNVPISTQTSTKSSSLPPLFPIRKKQTS